MINSKHLIISVLVTAVVYFICDGIIHGALLGEDYRAAMTAAGKVIEEDPTAYGYFALFDLGKAFVAMFVYVAARPRFGPGIRLAVLSGLIAWLGVEALPAIGAMPLLLLTKMHYTKVMLFELVPMVAGAVLGGFLYKEEVKS